MAQAEFLKQYNVSYATRLEKMTTLIMSNPTTAEYNLPLRRLNEDLNEECIAIAIMVLDSKLKFSILQMNDPNPESYLPGGKLFIEDFYGRIPIRFASSFSKLSLFCTGAVLGFVGSKDETNTFVCTDVIFPNPSTGGDEALQPGAAKVLLISNPQAGPSSYGRLKMLVDYFSCKADATVIFGDLGGDSHLESFNSIFKGIKSLKGSVFVVPGPNDPTTTTLPQYPLHPLLFDQNVSRHITNLTHPAQRMICGRRVVLMNKVIVDDLRRYVVGPSSHETVYGTASTSIASSVTDMDILEQIVRMRHIAPNCPDTMPSIPFYGNDPFVMDAFDYLICGKCDRLETRRVNGCHIVTIPDYQLGSQAVLGDFSDGTFTEVVVDKAI